MEAGPKGVEAMARAATKATKKRGISIYRAQDAVPLQDTDFMTAPEMTPETAQAFGASVTGGLSSGALVDVLVRQADAEGGFSLVRLWFKPHYPLVRHTHDADCLYYVLSGAAVMGNRTLRTGDAFFVPADAPYRYTAGPDGVEVLEIRHGVSQFNMVVPDEPPGRWRAMEEAAAANGAGWSAMATSPTMVANRG